MLHYGILFHTFMHQMYKIEILYRIYVLQTTIYYVIMAISPINNNNVIHQEASDEDGSGNNLSPDYNVILQNTDPYVNLDNDIVEEIAEIEEEFCETDKQNGNYYIGSSIYDPQTTSMLLSMAISPRSFFQYDIRDIQQYFAEYSCIYHDDIYTPDVDIVKLVILPTGEYRVIFKTFWLRWIQRAWKTRMNERRHIIRLRSSLLVQRHIELTGTYPTKLRTIPGLRGLLYKL